MINSNKTRHRYPFAGYHVNEIDTISLNQRYSEYVFELVFKISLHEFDNCL